jgi:hypothetical protein
VVNPRISAAEFDTLRAVSTSNFKWFFDIAKRCEVFAATGIIQGVFEPLQPLPIASNCIWLSPRRYVNAPLSVFGNVPGFPQVKFHRGTKNLI